VTEGNLDPETAWNLEIPDAFALLMAWAKHPPLRFMLSKFLGYDEERW